MSNTAELNQSDIVDGVLSISCLLDDINVLQNMVLYYENRILRKRVAIEELLQSRQCRAENVATAPAGPVTSPVPPLEHYPNEPVPSVRAMILAVLPEIEKTPFWYSDLKELCLARFPHCHVKLRKGIHPACHQMLDNGELRKVPGGLTIGNITAGAKTRMTTT